MKQAYTGTRGATSQNVRKRISEASSQNREPRKNRPAAGVGRLLVVGYAIFAIAATARAVFQILTKFDVAPVAYLLSALAAAIYLAATVCLGSGRWYRFAAVAVGFEFVGVLAVGTASIAVPAVFPAETVWSFYGRGYGFLPLILPVLGFWWLWKIFLRDYYGGLRQGDAGPKF